MKKLTKNDITLLANVTTLDDRCGSDPLFYFHTFNEEGEIVYQGYVSALTPGGSGRATLFSFLTGFETSTIIFGPLFLTDLAVYGSDYEMNIAYEKYQSNRNA